MTFNDFASIDAKVFHLNQITKELFDAWQGFCAKQTNCTIGNRCNGCAIKELGYTRGLSCMETLNMLPGECLEIFRGGRVQ